MYMLHEMLVDDLWELMFLFHHVVLDTALGFWGLAAGAPNLLSQLTGLLLSLVFSEYIVQLPNAKDP